MNESKQEITLANPRIHWGVFMPAIMAFIFMAFIGTVFTIFIRSMGHAFNSASQPVSWFPLLMMLVMLSIPVVCMTLQAWLIYSKSEIILTSRRLKYNSGIFFARRSGELPLEHIEMIFISEAGLGRILGWGTVHGTTLGGNRFLFTHIASPREFHAALQAAVKNAKP